MLYSSSSGSDGPPLSRASLVIGLYATMALIAVLIAAGRGDPDLYRLGDPTGWLLACAPLVGAALGGIVVVLTRVVTTRYAWARTLHASFRDLLGPLTGRDILIIAVASAVGEELLFRGALLPWLGLWPQTAIFALLHIGPGKRFVPWTLSAIVLGAVFGELALRTGSLGGPIAAHFTINFLNLRYIVARPVSSLVLPAPRP